MPWCIEMLNAKLKACRESKDADGALRIHAAAVAEHNASPDNITVKLLLDTCGAAGRLPEALRIYEEAERAGLVPDPLTTNSLIRHYCAANLPGRAFGVYEAAGKRKAPSPNLRTLTLLSESCSVASAAARTAEGRSMWMGRSLRLYTAGQALLGERSSLSYVDDNPPTGKEGC
jgi:pentatricopeptide repeat protein